MGGADRTSIQYPLHFSIPVLLKQDVVVREGKILPASHMVYCSPGSVSAIIVWTKDDLCVIPPQAVPKGRNGIVIPNQKLIIYSLHRPYQTVKGLMDDLPAMLKVSLLVW
jgi:hypothetical protein